MDGGGAVGGRYAHCGYDQVAINDGAATQIASSAVSNRLEREKGQAKKRPMAVLPRSPEMLVALFRLKPRFRSFVQAIDTSRVVVILSRYAQFPR